MSGRRGSGHAPERAWLQSGVVMSSWHVLVLLQRSNLLVLLQRSNAVKA